MRAAFEKSSERTVRRIAERLIAVQHAVADMAGGRRMDIDPRALEDAVRKIRSALIAVDGAYGVFIGGLAVQQHGYERFTEDVDVVIDRDHFDAILQKLRDGGFVIQPDFSLINKHTGAKVDLLQEGTRIKRSRDPLPHPSELGVNGGFATLSALIRLKLNASRAQDKADIVNILKRHMERRNDIEMQLPDYFRAEFSALSEQAARELE